MEQRAPAALFNNNHNGFGRRSHGSNGSNGSHGRSLCRATCHVERHV
jgi:hypothetical protein